MVIEGLITTSDPDGAVRVSPLGPIVPGDFSWLRLRPFEGSRTLDNLRRSGVGAFHVTDDMELIARAAIHRWEEPPPLQPLSDFVKPPPVDAFILTQASRWHAFRIVDILDEEPRRLVECEVVASGRLREMEGLCRAKFAVLEAAILATRVGLVPADEIRREVTRLAPLVGKTAGPGEQRAFALLQTEIDARLGNS